MQKKIARFLILLLVILIQFVFVKPQYAYAAATDPDLGQSASFSILSSTYTNTVGGTTIGGDLGYTTGPAVTPTVNGVTFVAPASKYTTAGIDQGTALANLNSQDCTSLGGGAVALDSVHAGGIYTPGCYSSGGAMNITTGQTVTLNGAGTYIFRPAGALNPAANTTIVLTNGASACDVFWAPTAATTIGANSTFIGTDIDASGITIGSTVAWTGRALAYGGTVSTATDTISSATCTAASTPTPAPTSSSNSTTSDTTTSNSGGVSIPYCAPLDSQTVAPIIIESKRISPTSISINWGPYSGLNTFNVEYGTVSGNWLYNTDVTGFSTTINNLPTNAPIWVRVAVRSDCTIGDYGQSKLVGGPSLPNTGFAPSDRIISWFMPANIFSKISYLFSFSH